MKKKRQQLKITFNVFEDGFDFFQVSWGVFGVSLDNSDLCHIALGEPGVFVVSTVSKDT